MMPRLKELRVSHGLSQKQLAKIVGVSQQTISEYEKGNIYPNMYNVISIADFFKISIDELIGRAKPDPEEMEPVICPFCIPKGYLQKIKKH